MIWCAKRFAAAVLLLLVIGWTVHGQSQVPAVYQSIYGELETLLTAFEVRLQEKENDSDSEPVTFGVHLPLASSNRASSLLNENLRYSLQWQLNALKAFSIDAVYVEINFPILTRSYHSDEETYRRYEDFYAWLAGEIQLRGMKLIVKSQANFTNLREQPDTELSDYYQQLSFDEYKQARMETALAVASIVRPDYLVVQVEPDTEEAVTGQPVNDVVNSVDMIQFILKELEAAQARTMPVGAGIGSWHRDYQLFAEQFVNSTTIDFLDVHVYPINYDFLERIDTLKNIAGAAGKKISISEAWLYKSAAIELLYPAPDRFIPRDPYQFWAPLDARFLTAMVKLARHHQMEFFAPFWSNYLSAYVRYDDVQGASREAVSVWLAIQSFTNWLRGDLTESGRAYVEAILLPEHLRR